MKLLYKIIYYPFIVVGALLYHFFVHTFVVYKFYYWFVTPVWHTPSYTFYQIMSAMFFISAIFLNPRQSIKKPFIDTTQETFKFVLTPWLMLIVGYLFKILFIS